MRRLLLIRHGKSCWDRPHLCDHDRPLNRRGLRDAPLMAQRVLTKGLIPEVIFSSSAIRALGIAKVLSSTLSVPLITAPQLYTFCVQTMIAYLKQIPGHYHSIALVGHNPAITSLTNQLCHHTIDNVPTSGIVALRFDCESWSEVDESNCHFDFFDYPKALSST